MLWNFNSTIDSMHMALLSNLVLFTWHIQEWNNILYNNLNINTHTHQCNAYIHADDGYRLPWFEDIYHRLLIWKWMDDNCINLGQCWMSKFYMLWTKNFFLHSWAVNIIQFPREIPRQQCIVFFLSKYWKNKHT